MRGKKIMLLSKRHLTQIFFVIPFLLFGLLFAPAGYAEGENNSLSKAIYGPVKSSDTLGKIVSRNYPNSALSSDQIMMGILRSNPDAFIGGNIHFLLRGSTLLLPDESLIQTIDKNEATQTIKNHYSYFQRGKTGNFKVTPLIDNTAVISDKAEPKVSPDSITSAEAEKQIKVDQIAQQIKDSRSIEIAKSDSPEVEEIEPAVRKPTVAPVKEAVQSITTPRSNSSNNAIKDIELESLKIKVSQLEKILRSRGLTASTGASSQASEQFEKILSEQKDKISQLEAEKKSKADEVSQLNSKITELEASIQKMSQSLRETESQATGDKDQIISALKKENSELQGKLASLQAQLDDKTKEVTALNLEINNSKQKIDELENKLISSDKESAKLDQQIAEMEAKLAQIRQSPATGLGVTNDAASPGMKPWFWLIPALFLLSVLGYLAKRSFSQPRELVAADVGSRVTQPPSQKLQSNPIKQGVKETAPNKAITATTVPDVIASASEEESLEASVKIDIAKAYMDMLMPEAAKEVLQEAFDEGSQKQRIEAKHLLEKISA